MDMILFGKRLREKRKAAGYTQKKLAEIVGSKNNSVSGWENGKNMPDPDTLVLICEALNVGASYLLNTPDNAESENDCKHEIVDMLYISMPRNNAQADEVRKYLHEIVDQLDDETLLSIMNLNFRMSLKR